VRSFLAGIVIVAAASAVATVLLGWWAVPIVGALWALGRGDHRPVLEASAGAALAWALLLGVSAVQGEAARVAVRVGGVFGLPGTAFTAITIVFGALLAGTAAAFAGEIGRLRPGRWLALVALCAGLCGSLPAQSAPDSAIRAEVARYVAAVNRGDARALADLYARSGNVSSAGDGEVTRGWSEIRALLSNFLSAVGRITMTADSLTVTPLGDRAAVAVFLYDWAVVREADTTRLRGVMTLVFERQPEGWRVVHDHTSTRPADRPGVEGGGESPSVARSGPIRETEPCTVERIVDGDTLVCRGGLRVRLIGIDTPELSQQPFGEQARAALAALVPPGAAVLLERDVELTDRYGRRLAYLWRDGVFVNWQMLRGGWAVLLTYPPNVQYVEHFQEAQRLAREQGRGLWATGGFACAPADRRRGRCD
jgi:micrococcal nuclease